MNQLEIHPNHQIKLSLRPISLSSRQICSTTTVMSWCARQTPIRPGKNSRFIFPSHIKNGRNQKPRPPLVLDFKAPIFPISKTRLTPLRVSPPWPPATAMPLQHARWLPTSLPPTFYWSRTFRTWPNYKPVLPISSSNSLPWVPTVPPPTTTAGLVSSSVTTPAWDSLIRAMSSNMMPHMPNANVAPEKATNLPPDIGR